MSAPSDCWWWMRREGGKVKGSLGVRESWKLRWSYGGDICIEWSLCPDITTLNCNPYLNSGGRNWLIHFNSPLHTGRPMMGMKVNMQCHYRWVQGRVGIRRIWDMAGYLCAVTCGKESWQRGHVTANRHQFDMYLSEYNDRSTFVCAFPFLHFTVWTMKPVHTSHTHSVSSTVFLSNSVATGRSPPSERRRVGSGFNYRAVSI